MQTTDELTFEGFFRTNHPRLVRAVRMWTGDPGLAEDVSQDVMITLLHYWGRYDRPELLMYRLARQQMTRTTRRHLSMEEELDPDRPTGPAPDAGSDDLEQAESRLDVMSALRRLPSRQREVIVLSTICDLDLASITEILGVSASAVKTHRARGLQSLQKLLARRPPVAHR